MQLSVQTSAAKSTYEKVDYRASDTLQVSADVHSAFCRDDDVTLRDISGSVGPRSGLTRSASVLLDRGHGSWWEESGDRHMPPAIASVGAGDMHDTRNTEAVVTQPPHHSGAVDEFIHLSVESSPRVPLFPFPVELFPL